MSHSRAPGQAGPVALRRKREFQLMARVADALIAPGRDGMVTYRLYAQALLDQGLTGAGWASLAARMAAGDDVGEQAELQGLIARANKDRYVATGPAAGRRRTLHLERAVQGYHQAWVEDRTRLWHGINAAALLNRTAWPWPSTPIRRRWPTRLAERSWRPSGSRADAPVFDLATAVEANVALGRFEQAHRRSTSTSLTRRPTRSNWPAPCASLPKSLGPDGRVSAGLDASPCSRPSCSTVAKVVR